MHKKEAWLPAADSATIYTNDKSRRIVRRKLDEVEAGLPNMLFRSIVDQTFYVVFTIGHYVGARLWRCRHVEDSAGAPYFRKLLFLCGFVLYCFGVVLLILMGLPIPINGSIPWALDPYAGYALTWGGFLLDGFSCFITINYATNFLLDNSGFTDRCREVAPIAQPSPDGLRKWKRTSIKIVFLFGCLLCAQAAVTVLAATDTVRAPVQMERVAYWTGLPLWLAWVYIGCIAFSCMAHIGYHCIFFCNTIEIVRLHLHTFNECLNDEKAVTMTKRRLDTYHGEYCRIIAMVHNLDHAFRESTFCQLSLVTMGSCLILFLYTKGDDAEMGALIFITFTLSAIIFTFSFTVVPAILLDNQVSRPKGLLRAWFLKYEQHCNIYELNFCEDNRLALSLFMQSVTSEDAAITIASLAKLNAQLLLTLGSLILTYFLVIVQFDQTQPMSHIVDINQTCYSHGYTLK